MQKTKNSESATKYKAIKYIRLSQADNNPGESDSIANQRRIIDEFLKKHPEIEVVGEKIDDGWSGILFDRPGFNEMMDEFKKGKANCCVTKDLSRFGREFIETGRYLRYVFPTLGVRFIAITDNVDTLTDSGDDLIVSIKTIINDSYSQDISIKTRSALTAKRANGEYVGAFPIYEYKKSDHNHNLLVVDEYSGCMGEQQAELATSPAEIVRNIFRMRIDGLSAARIADTLNEQGVLSPHKYKKHYGLPHPTKGFADKEDAKWGPSSIIRILKDETYTGTLIQGISSTPNYKIKQVMIKPSDEWKRVENAHEAIIAKQTFELVQKILALDTRIAPNGEKVYLFSGILICGSCGCRMTRKIVKSNNTEYFYYCCKTTKKSGCAASGMVKEDEFIEYVFKKVKSHILNVIKLERSIADFDINKITSQITKKINAQINEKNRELEKIHRHQMSIYEIILGALS